MAKTTKESKLFEGFNPPVAKEKTAPQVKTEEIKNEVEERKSLELPKKEDPIIIHTPSIVKTEPKKMGRPKKYDDNEVIKTLKVYLPQKNYDYIKIHGGEHDGMNGYINYLIEKDMMERRGI